MDSDNYIKSPQEWLPIPGSIEAIALNAGWKVAVAAISPVLHAAFLIAIPLI